MQHCRNCGWAYNGTPRYCATCGKPIQTQQQRYKNSSAQDLGARIDGLMKRAGIPALPLSKRTSSPRMSEQPRATVETQRQGAKAVPVSKPPIADKPSRYAVGDLVVHLDRIFKVVAVRRSVNGWTYDLELEGHDDYRKVKPKASEERFGLGDATRERFVVFEDLARAVGPMVHTVRCEYYHQWLTRPGSTTTWHGPYDTILAAQGACRDIAKSTGLPCRKAHACVST